MKNLFLILLSIGLCHTSGVAQEADTIKKDESRKEKIEALKVAYITKQVGLSSDDAEKFWPVYNEFSDKKEEIALKKKGLYEGKSVESYSDEEIGKKIEQYLAFEADELKLQKTYVARFRKLIGNAKTAKLLIAEVKFRSWLLHQMQNRRGNRGEPQRMRKPQH